MFNVIEHFTSTVSGFDRLVEVPSYNVGNFKESMASMQKRALRLGCEPIVVVPVAVIVVQTERVILSTTMGSPDRRYPTTVTMHVFVVKGGMPKIPDAYVLQGTVEFHEGGAVISGVPGEEIPTKYRQGVNECDHCRKDRVRNGAVLVRKVATGETLQVGGQCVKDFLGADLKRFLAGFEFQKYLTDSSKDMGSSESWGRVRSEIPTSLYLAAVCCSVRLHGFRPSNFDASTKYMAEIIMTDVLLGKDPAEFTQPADEDYAMAERMKVRALEMLKKSNLSDFEWNMKMGLESENLIDKTKGVLAAIFKIAGEDQKKEENQRPSEHVGVVGTKLATQVTYVRSVSFDSQWGTTHYHMFQDTLGNALMWKTSSGLWFGREQILAGDKISILGTVKKHTEYKGTQQTELTRVKIQDILS